MFAFSANLNAFTAVTSGAWSSAATWGGVGPGSTVLNQDIIIPSGITVDMDMDVTFNGLLNSFQTNGMLMNTVNHSLYIDNGTFSGSGAVTIHKLKLTGVLSTYSFTGPVTADVITNNGAVVSFGSVVMVADTLDLNQGVTTIGAGGDLQLGANAVIRVYAGSLVNNGMLTINAPYEVWYFGGTKTAGPELSSMWLQDVHLMLDNNLAVLTLSGNTTMNGMLTMQTGHVALNGNRLVLNGDYTAGSGSIFESNGLAVLEVGGSGGNLSSGLYFSAGSSLDKLIISRDTHEVWLESDLLITDSLILSEGTLVVDTSGGITMLAGSTIVRDYGKMEVQGGSFDGTQLYNVAYTGSGDTTGVELWGSGLNNIEMNLDYSQWVMHLSQDLTVTGNLNLVQGEFNLNDSDLVINGTFDQVAAAPFWGTLNSSLTLSMSTSVNDTLFMRAAFYPLEELIIDLPAGSSMVTLGGDLSTTKLTFIRGKISVGDYVLKVGTPNPTITGANDTNYVVMTGQGWLKIYMTGNDPYYEYPIGTTSNYAPIAIRSVGATANHNGYVAIRVANGVWTNGYTGTDVSTSQSVVNKTWDIHEDSGMVMNMDVRPGWGLLSEMNGFDRQNCFVKNYYNNMWDSDLAVPAATGSSNTYTVERMGMQNSGLFAVVDNNSPLSVPEPVVSDFGVYPNPSTDVVNVQISNPDNSTFQYELFDAAGRKVLGVQNANTLNQFDLRNYENGSYTMRVTNLSTNEVVTRLIIKS